MERLPTEPHYRYFKGNPTAASRRAEDIPSLHRSNFRSQTAVSAITRLEESASLESSIRECKVSNSPPECPGSGTHLVSGLRRCRQR